LRDIVLPLLSDLHSITMKAKKIIYQIILITLMALWIPISLDKLINFELFRSAMIQQPFSDQLGMYLAYTLPPLELAVGLLFIMPKTRIWAFSLSSLMMLAFVAYVGLAVMKVWGKFPCGCGLVFQQLGWTAHLWLNMAFLVVSLLGLWLELSFLKHHSPINRIIENNASDDITSLQVNSGSPTATELKTSHRLQKE